MSQGMTSGMNGLEILHAKIERGYRLAKDPEKRPILTSALELVEAAAVTGTALTLNPVQTAALAHWLEYHHAAQELGIRDRGAAREDTPGTVVAFPGAEGLRHR